MTAQADNYAKRMYKLTKVLSKTNEKAKVAQEH